MLAESSDIAGACRELGVFEQTYYRWRNQYGGLKTNDAKRFRSHEAITAPAVWKENCRFLGGVAGLHHGPIVSGVNREESANAVEGLTDGRDMSALREHGGKTRVQARHQQVNSGR